MEELKRALEEEKKKSALFVERGRGHISELRSRNDALGEELQRLKLRCEAAEQLLVTTRRFGSPESVRRVLSGAFAHLRAAFSDVPEADSALGRSRDALKAAAAEAEEKAKQALESVIRARPVSQAVWDGVSGDGMESRSLRCRSCGFVSAGFARFCGGCGAPRKIAEGETRRSSSVKVEDSSSAHVRLHKERSSPEQEHRPRVDSLRVATLRRILVESGTSAPTGAVEKSELVRLASLALERNPGLWALCEGKEVGRSKTAVERVKEREEAVEEEVGDVDRAVSRSKLRAVSRGKLRAASRGKTRAVSRGKTRAVSREKESGRAMNMAEYLEEQKSRRKEAALEAERKAAEERLAAEARVVEARNARARRTAAGRKTKKHTDATANRSRRDSEPQLPVSPKSTSIPASPVVPSSSGGGSPSHHKISSGGGSSEAPSHKISSGGGSSEAPSHKISSGRGASEAPSHKTSSASTPKESEEELPEGWVRATTVDGREYFFHSVSRLTRWDRPSAEEAERYEAKRRETEATQAARAGSAVDAHNARVAKEAEERQKADSAARSQRKHVAAWCEAAGWRMGKRKAIAPGQEAHLVLARLIATMPRVTALPGGGTPPTGTEGWDKLDPARADLGPSKDQVRKAYRRAARNIHPDRLATHAAADVKAAANEVFAILSAAHGIVADS